MIGWPCVSFPKAISFIFFLLISVCLQCASAQESSRFDGPAELPRVHVRSAMADTPAPGRTRLIKETDNLQRALDDAKCGDTLRLEAGAVFRGVFRFPTKSCDDAHWIVVRTSSPDDTLPAEGTRLTPCYAGVASLPGRPDLQCSSVRNVMAKLELNTRNSVGPVLFLNGANHYRMIGLEITRAVPELKVHNLVQLQDQNESAHHLVFDRLWLHGMPTDETKAGLALSGMTDVAVVDSYFSDFHCIAKNGACTDAQAIFGGTGTSAGGPYKIENNFLEASGQSIMFGGGAGTTTPTDIEVRRNHLFKPMIWMPGEPGFVGAFTGDPFIVKNHFELKNAQRVLFEDNILENCWGGFSQAGFSILLTPANQGGRCPSCRVTDVIIRYSKISRVGSGLQIATATGNRENPMISSGGERFSIHDVLITDVEGKAYKGLGVSVLIVSTEPPLKDVRIDHVTVFSPLAAVAIINREGKLSGISITNSILGAGERGIFGAGGGAENCTSRTSNNPADLLGACFDNPVFSHNLIIGGKGKWPGENMLVNDVEAAGLWKTENSSEYRVCRKKGESPSCKKTSVAVGAAGDGKDVGADVDAIENATAGIL